MVSLSELEPADIRGGCGGRWRVSLPNLAPPPGNPACPPQSLWYTNTNTTNTITNVNVITIIITITNTNVKTNIDAFTQQQIQIPYVVGECHYKYKYNSKERKIQI